MMQASPHYNFMRFSTARASRVVEATGRAARISPGVVALSLVVRALGVLVRCPARTELDAGVAQ